MAGFDTTNVAATVGQGVPANPFNPLQTVQGLAATQNLLNQNRLFQAQRAVGAAAQGAVNPFTGAYDPATANTSIAGDPNAAVAAPEAIQGNLAYQAQAQALAARQMDYARNTIGAVASSPNANPGAVASVTDSMVASGAIPKQMGDYIKSSMPTDPKQLGPWAQNNFQFPALGAGGALAATQPAPTMVQTGAGQIPEVLPEIGVPHAAGPMIANALGPSDLSTRVATVDDAGTQHIGVLGDYVNPDGSWKSGVPHPVTALGPLSSNAQGALGALYGPQIAAFEQSAGAAPAQRQTIENLRQEAAGFSQGPHADAWKTLGELMSEYNVTPPPGFGSSDQTAAAEAFTKSMTMLMGAQQQMLHMYQTDASRQTAQGAVPGLATTPAGRQQVLGILEGNADMLNAAGKAWQAQKAKLGVASWGQFQMEFPNRVPPSVFQAQYMTPAQIAAMQKGWSQPRTDHWNAVKAAAQAQGWLPNAQ